jgi:WD40 repeat protein
VNQRLRIFVSSPGDVTSAREIAALTIERLTQDYARLLTIEPYLWEFEAMLASGHFQDSIEPPSAFDIVVLIVWSRLGTALPERTSVREYRGIDGRAPVTGTEWEFEEALQAARTTGAPDLLVYRDLKPAPFHTHDAGQFEQQATQLRALNDFWERHFKSQGTFTGAYTTFISGAEFASAFENHLRKLIEKRIARLARDRNDTLNRAWAKAPFRGLESYEFEHAAIFFGQDEALAKAMLQLTSSAESGAPFLLLLGASGSGKSSLAKAGVVPKLFVPRRVPGAAFVRRATFRPSDALEGEDLFDALARRLTTSLSNREGVPELIEYGQSPSSLADHLRNARAAPAYPIATALGRISMREREAGDMLDYESAKLVLVVDQLEELFTVERITSAERRQFVELLTGLVDSGFVWVVATMRIDFWFRSHETPELVRLADGNRRLELLAPGPTQLSQMIRRPAQAAGLQFEVDSTTNVPLNEAISEEVAREPGALPLLSYLLDQLYRMDVVETDGTTLTYATYARLGKLEGAIATRAEAVLERCLPEDRQALGSVLFSLIEMGVAQGSIARAVARRVPLSTFAPGTAQRRLVEALLDPDARLLVSDAEHEGNPMVRVAHEALISSWSQARDFVQSNAEALNIRRRIEDRHAMWRVLSADGGKTRADESASRRLSIWRWRLGREPGLLSEIDLTDARRLLREHRAETDPPLIAYIERSMAHDKRIRSRSVRVLSAVVIVVTLLAIIASAAGLVASARQREAQYHAAEAIKAQSRLLTEAAARHLKDADVPGAQGIILEVLTNPELKQARSASAISVFQEIRAADRQIAVLSGHQGYVRSVVYSPDGTRIATASSDNTGGIWDARLGVRLAVLVGHTDRVYSAAYSHDGARIVTASLDKTARTWRAGDGTLVSVLSGHDDAVTSAAYSPDDAHIVTASRDKTARIWNAASGTLLTTLSGHGDVIRTAAYSPDGARIVTASLDRTARIWDARSGAVLAVLTGHDGSVMSAVYSPDGSRIVTASEDKTARIWDAHTGKQLVLLTGHASYIGSAAYSPDGAHIVTWSIDNTVRIWDATTGAQLAVFTGAGDFNAASYSPDGAYIVAGLDFTARIFDAHIGGQLKVLSGHGDSVGSAVYSPDGTRILTASNDKTLRIWDAATGTRFAVLKGHDQIVYSARYSPDSSRIVSASADKTARTWDTATGAPLTVLSGNTNFVNAASYSPDGNRIVTASSDKTVRIWDARSATQLALLDGHGDWVETAVYSPNGTRIVTASGDKTVRIWNARSGTQLAVLSGHAAAVLSAAYSPDGTLIVTASRDRTVRIWDAGSATQLAVLAGHGYFVNSATYSPDGTRIVTASGDKTVRIWDAHVPADLEAQIAWSAAARADALSDTERIRLGLPATTREKSWSARSTPCDQAAAAFYDLDKLASGVAQADINVDIANTACAKEVAKSPHPVRFDYQWGRALLAKHDPALARRQFEFSIKKGYRAADVDLGNLLTDGPAGMRDPEAAVSHYETAWTNRVPVAAFALGHLYEYGLRSANAVFPKDTVKAWAWYQKGADVGEPSALARFGERAENSSLTQQDPVKTNALLLEAFRFYASATERAREENWPDEALRHWRYRRATLAKLLARAGMMRQVAEAYAGVRDRQTLHVATLWEKIRVRLQPILSTAR